MRIKNKEQEALKEENYFLRCNLESEVPVEGIFRDRSPGDKEFVRNIEMSPLKKSILASQTPRLKKECEERESSEEGGQCLLGSSYSCSSGERAQVSSSPQSHGNLQNPHKADHYKSRGSGDTGTGGEYGSVVPQAAATIPRAIAATAAQSLGHRRKKLYRHMELGTDEETLEGS